MLLWHLLAMLQTSFRQNLRTTVSAQVQAQLGGYSRPLHLEAPCRRVENTVHYYPVGWSVAKSGEDGVLMEKGHD